MHSPLTVKDHNKTVTVKLGETVKIVLNGNPTTGYTWTRAGFLGMESLSDEHLEVTSKYTQSPTPSGMVGVGGSFMVTVTTKMKGHNTLELLYIRPFEGLKLDSQKFILHFIVE
ncbi:inhibitor of cysteine peptidase [Leishmania panamensis]|uniref:Inhibitor of cysteine peptidase n=3 Tax=Leishmania guyanensis species complex TaxID=38579 RepID=A0A088SAY2_LEIPA|nr:inhibitor of cysteine peptidase [Leishmania panamensis]AIN98806.1 inhibitor of cysteine peptidase [Leishmania panamensis]CCM19019.1 Putative inhibitor of cysteine peptidase [Leishmania guyanensis]